MATIVIKIVLCCNLCAIFIVGWHISNLQSASMVQRLLQLLLLQCLVRSEHDQHLVFVPALTGRILHVLTVPVWSMPSSYQVWKCPACIA